MSAPPALLCVGCIVWFGPSRVLVVAVLRNCDDGVNFLCARSLFVFSFLPIVPYRAFAGLFVRDRMFPVRFGVSLSLALSLALSPTSNLDALSSILNAHNLQASIHPISSSIHISIPLPLS